VVIFRGAGQFIQILEPGARVIDRCQIGEIAGIGGAHELAQIRQAIETFAQRGQFPLGITVTLFHPTVDFKEGDIVGGAFHPGHDASFVVEFQAGGTHLVADACTLNTGAEIVAHFALIGGGELTAEEGGDLIDLNRLDGGADNGLIEGLKLGLLVKDNVGGEFHLHEAPVVTGVEVLLDGAELLDPAIQAVVKGFGVESIGQRLSPLGIAQG